MPGFTRQRSETAFAYFDTDGRLIKDPALIARIDALAIPPAYIDVWICADPQGHIQATGRDERGRKQYRYHPSWVAVRDANKYHQLLEFGLALPRIRRQVERDLKVRGVTRDKVTAAVVQLLESTLIRIGTPQYAKDNKSFGLTTLRRRHATVSGNEVRLRFRGKSGIQHDVSMRDRRIASIIKKCMEIPGQDLFQFQDSDGIVHNIDSGCVNAYLKRAGGGEFTAKHYRTWTASVFALSRLQKEARSGPPTRSAINQIVKETARLLNNTAAVCRNCYIYPEILAACLQNGLPERQPETGPRGLNADERRFLAFLRRFHQ